MWTSSFGADKWCSWTTSSASLWEYTKASWRSRWRPTSCWYWFVSSFFNRCIGCLVFCCLGKSGTILQVTCLCGLWWNMTFPLILSLLALEVGDIGRLYKWYCYSKCQNRWMSLACKQNFSTFQRQDWKTVAVFVKPFCLISRQLEDSGGALEGPSNIKSSRKRDS